MIKLVESAQYHLWTDALHGRALARQAKNNWDRGTYVRWTILSAWSAFEMVCGDVLEASGLGMRFKDNLDKAVAAKGLPRVDWGQGIWQRAAKVYEVRKEFTHVKPTIDHARLLAPATEAELAITMLRDAIKEVCRLVGLSSPPWADDDEDRGWDAGPGSMAHITAIRDGADPDGPDTIRIGYVMNGKEYFWGIFPPGTAHEPQLDTLVKCLNGPVQALRAYRGKELLVEWPLKARGA